MARAKRALEEVDSNIETNPAKSSKANDGRRRSSRLSGNTADGEDSTPVKTGKKRSTSAPSGRGSKPAKGEKAKKKQTKTPNQKKKNAQSGSDGGSSITAPEDGSDSNKKYEDYSPEDRIKYGISAPRSRYGYTVGEPPKWDWLDQHPDQGRVDAGYVNMMQEMSGVKWCPIEEKPDHKWILMDGALSRQADGVYEARDRDPFRFDMRIDGKFEEYGMHQVVENFLVDYRMEFTKKAKDQDLREMWVILSGLIHFLQEYKGVGYLLREIDDTDRVCGILKLIGTAFLSLLNLLERADRLKADSELKDLGLVMIMYLIWGQEWVDEYASSIQGWNVKVLKYAQDHKIDLTKAPPERSALTVEKVQARAQTQKAWRKPGIDRWAFKKAFKEHEAYVIRGDWRKTNLGGQDMSINAMTKAQRKRHNIYRMDPLDRVPKEGIFPDMISHMNEWF